MPETPKNLGQTRPATETLVDAYTVPVGKHAVVSTIVVCNLSDEAASFRVAHAVGGAADTPAQYLFYDEKVPGNKSFTITIGMCLSAGDVIRVRSDNGDLVFNIYGVEV